MKCLVEKLNLKKWIKDSLPSDISRVVDSNLATQEGESDAKVDWLTSMTEMALKSTEESHE